MGGLGVPSGVIRFACHIPLGMLGFGAQAQSDFVHKHGAELLDPRFNHNIGRGERVLGIAGMFAFWWNFLLWIPTILAPGILLFFIGLVDLGIVIALIVGIYLQSTYLPQSKGACRGADTWQVSNGTESWFHVVATVSNSTYPEPQTKCEEYVEIWIIAVAMAAIYSISAFLNIVLGGFDAASKGNRTTHTNYNYNRSQQYSNHNYNYNPPQHKRKAILKTIGSIFLLPAYVLWAILPKKWQAKLRYSWRYVMKSTKRVPVRKAMRLRPLHRKKTYNDKNAERLARTLSMDVLTPIAYKLHYVDLVSLSLVSRSVRKAIFPDSAVDHNAEHFRVSTCDAGTKSQCWGCNIQICNGCRFNRDTSATKTSLHVDKCKAYCSDCYFKNISRYKGFHTSCYCTKETFREPGGVWMRDAVTMQFICRICSQLPVAKLQECREARDKEEMVRLSRQPLNCSECTMSLGSLGPRWWICTMCQSECRSSTHPAWAPKMAV